MTHSTGLPDIAIGTANWGAGINAAFEEANRRLTKNGVLSPLPRPRTDTEDVYVGETPNWLGQVYIQTMPYTIWISVGLLPTDWKQFQEFVDFSEDRLVGTENPNHMVTIVEDADDIVTNEGLVPDYVGQRYLQSVGNVIWFAEGTTNTSWKRLSEFLVGWTEITEGGTHNLLNVLELEVYLMGSAGTGAASGGAEDSTVSIDGVDITIPGGKSSSTPGRRQAPNVITYTGASIDLLQVPVEWKDNQRTPGSATAVLHHGNEAGTIQTFLNNVGNIGNVFYCRVVKTTPTDLDLVVVLGAGQPNAEDTYRTRAGRTPTGILYSNQTEAEGATVRIRYR